MEGKCLSKKYIMNSIIIAGIRAALDKIFKFRLFFFQFSYTILQFILETREFFAYQYCNNENWNLKLYHQL